MNESRRRRIARGSGTTVQDVNQLVKQFDQVRKLFGERKRNPRRLAGDQIVVNAQT